MKKIIEAEIIENTLAHFPKNISKEIHDYVINEALYHSRYLFVVSNRKTKRGFCTHCKKTQDADGYKHKDLAICVHCKSECRVQFEGYGRSKLIDEADIVYYEKSQINKEAIIARAFSVYMDYSGDFKDVKPRFNILGYYLFEMDNPVFLKYRWWTHDFELRKSVFSLFSEITPFGTPATRTEEVSMSSICKAVKGTPFQYSMYEARESMDDFVRYFSTYAKHPQIEYLYKLGFGDLVEKKVYGDGLNGVFNWRGKTIDKVFRLPKQELKEVINKSHVVCEDVLKIYQDCKRNNWNLTLDEILELKQNGLAHEWEKIKNEGKNVKRLINYLKRQMKLEFDRTVGEPHTYHDLGSVYRRLRDYWYGCARLGLTIDDDIPKFPRNLLDAHDNIYSQIEFKKNAELDRLISERYEGLNDLSYENNELFIRPFKSSKEVIEEGKALKHCVGGYTKSYAKGHTDLYAIRKKENPNEPYYTLEVQDGKITQYYGYENNQNHKKCDRVIAFVEEFETKILKSKKEIAS